MKKAVFLDYTGTITQEGCLAVQKVVKHFVKNSDLATPEAALNYWWSNLRELEESCFLETFKTEDEIVELLLEKCRKEIHLEDSTVDLHRLFQEFWSTAPAYEDAKQFFASCDLPIYVVTNNGVPYVQKCMELNDLHPTGIVSADMAKAYKPHKELFEKALEISGYKASEIIHIGDSYSSDVIGAKSAGIEAILLNREGKQVKGAVKMIDSLLDLKI